jgi:hypothetical protein
MTQPIKYDLNYLENLLRIQARTGQLIAEIRWDFIDCKKNNIKTILDYGSGVGFFRAFRPEGIEVDNYDVNPCAPQTGITKKTYDLVCLWDVLEHLTAPLEFDSKFITITVPIKPKDILLKDWYHFKPGEHLVYFSQEYLDLIFKNFGYQRIKLGQPECPPRKDVWSILYEKDNI